MSSAIAPTTSTERRLERKTSKGICFFFGSDVNLIDIQGFFCLSLSRNGSAMKGYGPVIALDVKKVCVYIRINAHSILISGEGNGFILNIFNWIYERPYNSPPVPPPVSCSLTPSTSSSQLFTHPQYLLQSAGYSPPVPPPVSCSLTPSTSSNQLFTHPQYLLQPAVHSPPVPPPTSCSLTPSTSSNQLFTHPQYLLQSAGHSPPVPPPTSCSLTPSTSSSQLVTHPQYLLQSAGHSHTVPPPTS